MNRRSVLVGAIALAPVLALSGCSSTVSLADVQRYAATAVAAFTAVVPLVETIDPTIAPQLTTLLTEVQAAEKAFAQLTTPANGAGTAQALLTLLNQAFTIVEAIPGIPTAYVAGIEAAQILLVTIAAFFNISVSTAMSMPRAESLNRAARAYATALPSDRKKLADSANSTVRAWIATLPKHVSGKFSTKAGTIAVRDGLVTSII